MWQILACQWHDLFAAKWLERHKDEIDIVHGWPLGSKRTIKAANRLGIPFVLERPNAHTAFAYEVVERESEQVGVTLPKGHDHRTNRRSLEHEEEEYERANALLCPSEFVSRTFRERGFSTEKLLRHQYGFDSGKIPSPGAEASSPDKGGIIMLYAGVCEPRKGLHRALEAWFSSGVFKSGKFLICGEFVPGYREALKSLLDHPSVELLGHRNDLPEIMRRADLFVLSSVEEGSALVTYEARGCGCVILVSDAAGAVCDHGQTGMIHAAGDGVALAGHISMLHNNREELARIRQNSVKEYNLLTWDHASDILLDCYRKTLTSHS